MNVIIYLYGFFFALPLAYLNIFPGGLKIDDIFLFIIIILLPVLMLTKNKHIKLPWPYIIFIGVTLLFSLLSFYKGISATDNFLGDSAFTVVSRIVQSLLIATFLVLIKNAPRRLIYFFKGYVLAASVSLLIFLLYYLSKINLASFVSRGVYFAKDIFQYNDDIPFTVHVNTLGSFFLIAFFIIRCNFKKYNIFSYLFIVPSFLLISKGDMLAVLIFFGFDFYRKSKFNALLLMIFLGVLLILSPMILEIYYNLAEYRVYTSGRDELYGAAIESIQINPLGYGLGMQNNILNSLTGIDFPAHNIFLSIGIELGIPYLVFGILFFFVWWATGKSKIDKIIFLSFLIIGFFGNAMYFYKFHSLAIALSLFGLWSISSESSKKANNNENSIHFK